MKIPNGNCSNGFPFADISVPLLRLFVEKNCWPHDTINFLTYHTINSCSFKIHSVKNTWKWQKKTHGTPLVNRKGNSRSKKKRRKIQSILLWFMIIIIMRPKIDLRAWISTRKVNKKFSETNQTVFINREIGVYQIEVAHRWNQIDDILFRLKNGRSKR